jgi:hypothetical protein
VRSAGTYDVHFAHLLLHHTFRGVTVRFFSEAEPAEVSGFVCLHHSVHLLAPKVRCCIYSVQLSSIAGNMSLYLSVSFADTSKFIDQQTFNAIT